MAFHLDFDEISHIVGFFFIQRSDATDYNFQALALLEIFVFLLLPLPGDVVVLGFWVGVSVMQC